MARQVGFYIDMVKCYGCKTCVVACKLQQKTATGIDLRKVKAFETDKPLAFSFLSIACNHCADPACLKVCPVKAYRKLGNGIVLQDHEKCIGCKMCLDACPYGTPQFDSQEKKTSKCDYCYDRYQKGQAPRCVESCPAGALIAGELDVLKATYVGVQAFPGLPKASVTKPSIVIKPAANVEAD